MRKEIFIFMERRFFFGIAFFGNFALERKKEGGEKFYGFVF